MSNNESYADQLQIRNNLGRQVLQPKYSLQCLANNDYEEMFYNGEADIGPTQLMMNDEIDAFFKFVSVAYRPTTFFIFVSDFVQSGRVNQRKKKVIRKLAKIKLQNINCA